jgi:hypothetical protein
MAMLPDAEKAYSDCLSTAKQVGGRFKTILKDDPKREYFEKLGAEFAAGFFAGTRVDHFDSIDLYNCLHREPEAVHYFYRADEALKSALYQHDEQAVIKAMDELIQFLAEMVMEDYPHSRVEVCREFKDRQAQWGDVKRILEDLKNPETTLQSGSDHHFFFNKVDVTTGIHNVIEDYIQQSWSRLGYNYVQTLLEAATH